MTTSQYIISFLELAAVVGVILLVFNENKIAVFEKRIFKKFFGGDPKK
jgi:hypothetical protein